MTQPTSKERPTNPASGSEIPIRLVLLPSLQAKSDQLESECDVQY